MYYKLEKKISPNYFTKAAAERYYRRARQFLKGAGHWWGLWQSNYSHAGIVNGFLNPARDGSANEVISDRLVTVMVEDPNVAITTQNGNIITKSIELDPQIMHRWRAGASQAQRAKANRIFETAAQRMADNGWHTKEWLPHNYWWKSTACNDIRWPEIVARANQIVKDRKAATAVKLVARETFKPAKPMIFKANTTLVNIPSNTSAGGSTFKKDSKVSQVAELLTYSDGKKFYRTQYSKDNNILKGFGASKLKDVVPPKPEWVLNLVDIKDIKLSVLPADGVPVFDFNTGKFKPESVIPKGTNIDIAKTTKVGGNEYIITNYSVTNGLPHGILRSALGVPVVPPVADKPEWLENLEDIKDVTMYARADAPVINFENGTTVSTIKLNTPVEIAEATEWHGQPHLITKWAAGQKAPHGIAVLHLSDKPIEEPTKPVEPAPVQPVLEPVPPIYTMILKLIATVLRALGVKD